MKKSRFVVIAKVLGGILSCIVLLFGLSVIYFSPGQAEKEYNTISESYLSQNSQSQQNGGYNVANTPNYEFIKQYYIEIYKFIGGLISVLGISGISITYFSLITKKN